MSLLNQERGLVRHRHRHTRSRDLRRQTAGSVEVRSLAETLGDRKDIRVAAQRAPQRPRLRTPPRSLRSAFDVGRNHFDDQTPDPRMSNPQRESRRGMSTAGRRERSRRCVQCARALPEDCRRSRRYCSSRCRGRAWRELCRHQRRLAELIAFCGEEYWLLHDGVTPSRPRVRKNLAHCDHSR